MHIYAGYLNIHGTHGTTLLYLLTQYMYIYAGCLNIHGTHGTAQLFLLDECMHIYAGCLNIHGTHGPANNSTITNVFFFCFRFENSTL